MIFSLQNSSVSVHNVHFMVYAPLIWVDVLVSLMFRGSCEPAIVGLEGWNQCRPEASTLRSLITHVRQELPFKTWIPKWMCQRSWCLMSYQRRNSHVNTRRREIMTYHSFRNHDTHKIIIFKLFRSLQLQFSGPTGINFRYSYSFLGLTGICLYSYSSVQLHKKGLRNYFPKITVTIT